MRISDGSSDVCSSDLPAIAQDGNSRPQPVVQPLTIPLPADKPYPGTIQLRVDATYVARGIFHVRQTIPVATAGELTLLYPEWRSEEPTSELQSLMRISYAVFCLQKKTKPKTAKLDQLHTQHTQRTY